MKKYVFVLLLSLLVVSCKKNAKKTADKSVDFSLVTLDSTNIKACAGGGCPDVELNYLKFQGDTEFSKTVNAKNKEALISLFKLDPDAPKVNSIDAAVNGFVEDYFQFKAEFPEAKAGYEAQVDQEVLSQNDKSLVIKTSFYLFTGGAHGYGGVHFLNFDAQTGKYLEHKDLIADISGFTDFVEEKFRQKYNIPPDADINAQGFFFDDGKFALPENIAVTADQVILLYNPYEAASYAQGQLRFVFPLKTVEAFLK